jgi:hypothetical protein
MKKVIVEAIKPVISGDRLIFERDDKGVVAIHRLNRKGKYTHLLGLIEDPMQQVKLASFLVRP